jgi:predicted nucleotidyltransferase
MKTENSADHDTDHISRGKITIKPDELQQAIEQAAAILKAARADAVYLFGSAVEGPVRPESDIDLAVAGLPPARFFQAMGQTMFVLRRGQPKYTPRLPITGAACAVPGV